MTHQTASFVKSMVRIMGFSILLIAFPVGVVVLILAEGLGIIEEIV